MIAVESVLAASHLAAAGLAAVAPLLVASLRLVRGVRGNRPLDEELRQVALWLCWAMVAVAVIGLAAGFVRWGSDSGYRDMLGRFPPHAYYMVAGEWVFSLLVYGGWLALWRRWRKKPWLHAGLALLGATNLLYHFPPLMIGQNLLAAAPALVASTSIERPAMLEVMSQPVVLAKTLHVVGMGAVVAAVAVLVAVRPAGGSAWTLVVRCAAGTALVALVAQWITGVAMLALLPASASRPMTGSSPAATMALVLGVLLTVHLMSKMARLSLSPRVAYSPTGLGAMLGCVILLMSLAARL